MNITKFFSKTRSFFANQWKNIKIYWSNKKRNFKGKVFFVCASLITAIISFFYSGVLNNEALQTLVQAEATLFGFFGIFFIYAVKQYDDELKETEREGVPKGYPLTKSDVIKGIKMRKKDLFDSARYIGICLTASMLLSVWLIGASEVIGNSINFFNIIEFDIIGFFSYMTLTLFLISILIFITLMKNLAKDIYV